MLSSIPVSRLLVIFLSLEGIFLSHALTNGIKTRSFVFSPKGGDREKPKLVLIGGCPGTGKSTFGMSVALDQGIIKCISTDTLRAVMRSFIPADISPALHRSSYAPASEDDDPVRSWRETCTVLEASVQEIVTDSIARGQGLVLEGVSIAPSKKLIKIWEDAGGVAIGCLLTIKEETHKSLLQKRGFLAGAESTQNIKDQKKILMFDRIRLIQAEMINLAEESHWILIEQKVEPDPLEIIANKLTDNDCKSPDGNRSKENSVHALKSKPERVAPSS
jgi:2-phosphoglycerate kinase